MAEIVHSCGCQKVLDIGCGDGKLLEHFLRKVSLFSCSSLLLQELLASGEFPLIELSYQN